MVPWQEAPKLEVDLDRPLAESLSSAPDDLVRGARALLDAVLREVPAKAKLLADAARLRTANRFHAEASTFAEFIGVSWRDVLLANLSYDLVLSMFGCSTIALPTAAGPVLARNMDWWPEDVIARASCLIDIRRGAAPIFVNAGWPGGIGVVSGMSARGFAVVLNAVGSPEGTNLAGYPVLLHLRRVVEDAKSFEEALTMLSEPKLASAGLFTLVGVENQQRVVVERSPTRFALRWSDGDKPLFATNDYRLLRPPESRAGVPLLDTTCNRYDSLDRLLGGRPSVRKVTDEELLYVLTDQSVLQSITAQHVIFRPREYAARLLVPRRFFEASLN